MSAWRRTPLYDRHVARGAKMVEFGGWEMPLLYPTGIVAEHLATRRSAGLFDVSHMGRLAFHGRGARALLQHVLTNNAAALEVGKAHYTLLPTETGGAVDDAYLYRFVEDEYLLVVNAANRAKDMEYLQAVRKNFNDAGMQDRTETIAMLSLQGPESRRILLELIQAGALPEPKRNNLSMVEIGAVEVQVSRTGYTGEPLCFELFVAASEAGNLWDSLIDVGATPVGLGARDTLRLEAGLPLYGHELGLDVEGREIPIFACPAPRSGVSFSPLKGEFYGRDSLVRQQQAYTRFLEGDCSPSADLPRVLRCLAVTGQGVARAGARVAANGRHVGWVTSGTMAPYWIYSGEDVGSIITEHHELRSICLALLDGEVKMGTPLTVEARGKELPAVVVPHHLWSEAPPYARPIVWSSEQTAQLPTATDAMPKITRLLQKAAQNTTWRQQECINLIPSEMTASPMVRLLSVMDPAFRYAEHKQVRAFYDADIFYYQGVDFIAEVERLLTEEMRLFLGCPQVESRVTSGQMANAVVFSAMVDYLNRADRKAEPRRMTYVANNDLGKGGHLSAQPMGALKDFIARDPQREQPAVVNFPVLPDNPYQIDVVAAKKMIDEHRPELIIFGKSMVLHREPVAEIRNFLDEQGIGAVVLYDLAHVLGLIGPHFQQPFDEGADIVTGSTHKTFFGTQRGVIGCRYTKLEPRFALWEAIQRRTFPGSVSNHHLGTMLGLLMAAYEMNHFRDEYQSAVIGNAKAFARALRACGLDIAGDPAVGYTETHQVVVNIGYGRGMEIAQRLEGNNIICNYQAAPGEEGFSAAGSLRMGVAEMTRFGMGPTEFAAAAALIAEVVLRDRAVTEAAKSLRSRFLDLRYCFDKKEHAEAMSRLRALL